RVALVVEVEVAVDRLGGAVAEGLVAAADGVVVDGHRVRVDVGPALAEAVGPDPRHPEAGEGGDLLEGDGVPLGGGDRIQVHVVGAGAGPDREQGDRLVQVVHHHRVRAPEGILGGEGKG